LQTNSQKSVTEKFSSSFRWSISGSFYYETLKMLHQIFLLKVMEASSYGHVGSIFSIIYLTIYLSEFGLRNSLPPFLNIFTQSKQNFKDLFIKFYVLPQVVVVISVAFIATFFYSKSFLNNRYSPFMLLIPLTIIFESIRMLFRRFFHNVFISKATVIVETVLITFYVSVVWVPHLFFGLPMTTNLVFIPYLIDSFLGLAIFTFMSVKYYKTLPEQEKIFPSNLWKRILKTRFFNYTIHVSQNFFTGNFLTPFFAMQFGLKSAGIFHLANHLAESIKAIMKVTILYSGGALFAKLKDRSLKIKQQAFKLLGEKLNIVVYPIIIFLIINYKTILKLNRTANIPQSTLSLSFLFLLITLMEYFFLMYDQFYVVEEQAGKLFVFKLLEFALFYGFIIANNLASPLTTLVGIIFVRTLSFVIISINAFAKWRIKPSFRIDYRFLISYVVVSILFYLIF